jgi:hypothetical protein
MTQMVYLRKMLDLQYLSIIFLNPTAYNFTPEIMMKDVIYVVYTVYF